MFSLFTLLLGPRLNPGLAALASVACGARGGCDVASRAVAADGVADPGRNDPLKEGQLARHYTQNIYRTFGLRLIQSNSIQHSLTTGLVGLYKCKMYVGYINLGHLA